SRERAGGRAHLVRASRGHAARNYARANGRSVRFVTQRRAGYAARLSGRARGAQVATGAPLVGAVVEVYSNSSSAPKRRSSTALRRSSFRTRASAAATIPTNRIFPQGLFFWLRPRSRS